MWRQQIAINCDTTRHYSSCHFPLSQANIYRYFQIYKIYLNSWIFSKCLWIRLNWSKSILMPRRNKCLTIAIRIPILDFLVFEVKIWIKNQIKTKLKEISSVIISKSWSIKLLLIKRDANFTPFWFARQFIL